MTDSRTVQLLRSALFQLSISMLAIVISEKQTTGVNQNLARSETVSRQKPAGILSRIIRRQTPRAKHGEAAHLYIVWTGATTSTMNVSTAVKLYKL
jgi:hypothetical protein